MAAREWSTTLWRLAAVVLASVVLVVLGFSCGRSSSTPSSKSTPTIGYVLLSRDIPRERGYVSISVMTLRSTALTSTKKDVTELLLHLVASDKRLQWPNAYGCILDCVLPDTGATPWAVTKIDWLQTPPRIHCDIYRDELSLPAEK